jgi:uncharacterized repeat protein (TIGR03803 family)
MVICMAATANAAPGLVKLHDFNNSNPLVSPGPEAPNDSPLLIGSKLWFTTEKGGESGFGTLSSFDLETSAVHVWLSMDISTGNSPKAAPTRDGDLLYITTLRGGTGDRGTLSVWDVASATHQVLWNSPSNSPNTNPNSLWGDVAVIDRGGSAGKDIYFMTQNGGLGSAFGTIQRYQTLDGAVTQIHSFQGAPDGKQPYKGFTMVGTDLYFTTFTGGLTGTGFAQGAGTLGKLDAATRGAETVSQLAAMPSGDGSLRFGVHNPYYRQADHSLYFNLLGTSTQSGALMKYDLTRGTLSTLHEIQSAPTANSFFPEGKLPYGRVAEWNRALYYTTIQGGNFGGGTINRYHLQTGQHEVLFHLDSDHAVNSANPFDNIGGEPRGGFVFNGSTESPAFYLLTRQGGNFDHGTILRLDLEAPLPPTAYEEWLTQFSGLAPGQTAPAADPDGDGRSNRDEFAFGTPPDQGADGGGFTAVAASRRPRNPLERTHRRQRFLSRDHQHHPWRGGRTVVARGRPVSGDAPARRGATIRIRKT